MARAQSLGMGWLNMPHNIPAGIYIYIYPVLRIIPPPCLLKYASMNVSFWKLQGIIYSSLSKAFLVQLSHKRPKNSVIKMSFLLSLKPLLQKGRKKTEILQNPLKMT